MQISASLNNLRIAPRKVRLVAMTLKGMDAFAAKNQLDYLAKRSSAHLSKLIDSAIANAHNNLGLVKDNLFIKEIIVNEGKKLKRFRPKGFGMASPIEKKTSHIKIILEEKVPGLKAESINKKQQEIKPESELDKVEEGESEKIIKTGGVKRPEVKKEIGKKSGALKGLGKRLFRRKAI